ncbi:MAG TPA: ABC transporter ATP-binding protein [Gemmatimonadaceae bacterium]|nr:ABC transporter ATP-binding protein [Gemmatimonadaceae bacterium]
MISITGLCKRYGAHEVLRGLDLEVAPGRVTAIVGPNGTGKTTLIKAILGLVRPDAGTIRVDGNVVGEDCGYRARIGYMPQIPRFPQNLTGAELLAMLRDMRAGSGAAGQAIDDDLVGRFQLASQLGKPVRTLSGGTQQKLNAVMAFLFAPSLLILDEPTAGLDPASSAVFKDRILAERDAGRTFVLSSHFMNELEELADDVVFLLEGKVQYRGAVEELMRSTRQANLGRAISWLMMKGAA